MKFVASIAATALLGLSMVSNASASPVYFKSPLGFAGTGCPAGSISVNGENTDTLSILFDAYDAGSDAASGQGRRASCSFAVPIQVPPGYQVSTLTADWQGFGLTWQFREGSVDEFVESRDPGTGANIPSGHVRRVSFP